MARSYRDLATIPSHWSENCCSSCDDPANSTNINEHDGNDTTWSLQFDVELLPWQDNVDAMDTEGGKGEEEEREEGEGDYQMPFGNPTNSSSNSPSPTTLSTQTKRVRLTVHNSWFSTTYHHSPIPTVVHIGQDILSSSSPPSVSATAGLPDLLRLGTLTCAPWRWVLADSPNDGSGRNEHENEPASWLEIFNGVNNCDDDNHDAGDEDEGDESTAGSVKDGGDWFWNNTGGDEDEDEHEEDVGDLQREEGEEDIVHVLEDVEEISGYGHDKHKEHGEMNYEPGSNEEEEDEHVHKKDSDDETNKTESRFSIQTEKGIYREGPCAAGVYNERNEGQDEEKRQERDGDWKEEQHIAMALDLPFPKITYMADKKAFVAISEKQCGPSSSSSSPPSNQSYHHIMPAMDRTRHTETVTAPTPIRLHRLPLPLHSARSRPPFQPLTLAPTDPTHYHRQEPHYHQHLVNLFQHRQRNLRRRQKHKEQKVRRRLGQHTHPLRVGTNWRRVAIVGVAAFVLGAATAQVAIATAQSLKA
ncbi:hypothetical protein F5Y12DRAFT_721589 [Xylaria sp. FL1777]|nr:hypothetical protein F5Y12DRAFT_721589 [Xylaria sp. FL1777]